jgi:hypothetical protein
VHSKTCVCDITFSPYTFFNSWKHPVVFFNFIRNFRLMRCSIFILVTNLAKQHNMVTLKQSSEANQMTWTDKSSLVRLPFTRSPLLQVSLVQCAQPRYFNKQNSHFCIAA